MVNIENAEQLKAFLKKESDRLNISINNTYNTFFSRLLLYKLSKIDNMNELIIKGSFAQLVHLRKMVRPITDIDITSVESHHDPLLLLIQAMSDKSFDIEYALRGKPKITTTGIYKVPTNAIYGKINHPINIDYRENYPILFKKEIKSVPKIFEGDEEYNICVPSLEETLAEKLYIVIKKNKIYDRNTRIKDLYDVYQFHGGEYDIDLFSYYFEKFIEKSKFVSKDDLNTDFLNKHFIEKYADEWEYNKNKYEFLDEEIDLEGSVYYTRAILSEQIKKIKQGKNKSYIYENNN